MLHRGAGQDGRSESRAAAQRTREARGNDAARLNRAFRLVLTRGPKPAERKIHLAGLERLRREFAARPQDAKKLLHVGESKRNESLGAVEHAAWTSLCLTLLNLDETVTRE